MGLKREDVAGVERRSKFPREATEISRDEEWANKAIRVHNLGS